MAVPIPKTISQLPIASALSGTEVFPVVQAAETRQAVVTDLGTFIFTGYAPNTFPARASTGVLEPKPITDYGLTLVTTTDATALLTSIGGQPVDATLSALALYNTNGILTQTAADTFVGRTLTGTTNRITVTNGDGVAGNPTVDISTSYVATVANGGTGLSTLTTGNYINALNATTFQQRTPADVRTDLGVTTCSNGTYTPTISNTVNVDATTPHVSQWLRVGNVVTVSGYIDIDTTAAGSTLTQLQISLPVASDITAIEQVAGSAAGNGVNEAGLILGNIANNTAALNFLSLATTSRATSYTFTYRVL